MCLTNSTSTNQIQTEDLYGIFLDHAKKKLQIHDSVFSQKVESETDVPLHLLQTLKGRENTLESIRFDIARTFPTLAIFDDGGPFYEPLHNLLGAYTCFRPDIGYVQGMSYLAAVLTLNLDEYDAFVCLANLLNKPILQTFYRVDDRRMNLFFSGFDKLLASFFPKIAEKSTSPSCSCNKPSLLLILDSGTLSVQYTLVYSSCITNWPMQTRGRIGFQGLLRTSLNLQDRTRDTTGMTCKNLIFSLHHQIRCR